MMTPGPRDFVIDTPAADAPAQDPLAAALATLSPSFTVMPEPAAARTRRRTWLDTFDWRLYRAGLMLQFEQARRGGRLLLSKADGTPQAEQPVTGWPRRPRLAEDLPDGPVRDRIIVLTRPRALLPIVRAVSTVSVTRLLNADGKTVARLVVDRTTVTAPSTAAPSAAAAGTTAELPPRLTVTAVRGYPAQARKAASLLATAPGISHASQNVFTTALTALGRHPADYTSGVEAEITATMPAPVAVARLLLRLLDTLELNVNGVLRDIDTEFLHDLRVAVRSTRSAIKLFGGVLPAELAEHYKTEFKWLGDLTTPTRDLDVHLLGFGPMMTGQLVAASPADLEPLRAFLIRRRAREFRRLATALRGPRFRAITDDWRKALLEIRDAGGARRRRPTAAALALATTGRAFRRIAAQGAAITQESPRNPCTTCANAPRSCATCWSSSRPCTTRSRTGGWSATSSRCRTASAISRTARSSAKRSTRWPTRCWPSARPQPLRCWPWVEIQAQLTLSQAEARAAFARRFARFTTPASAEHIRVLLEDRP